MVRFLVAMTAIAALLSFSHGGNKTVRRVLVVSASNAAECNQIAREHLDYWQTVGGRRFWPQRIVKESEPQEVWGGPYGGGAIQVRFTLEGLDGGEAERERGVKVWWDNP